MALDPRRPRHPDRRADGLGQDADRVSSQHRRVGPRRRRPRRRIARCHDSRLTFRRSRALSNDIRLNLEAPLAGIAQELARLGLPDPGIRTAVRTGDTSSSERHAMRRRAPHILVTTPESLYVLLSSDSGRAMLATTRTVIIDEIHAVAGSKRGSHLALSLERLDALCAQRPVRIGLSATQKPLEAVARFLVGRSCSGDAGHRDCAIVDVGHMRKRDLAIELPPVPLDAVMANDVWERVYDRMAELAGLHRTTLVFVNHPTHGRARGAPSRRTARDRGSRRASRQSSPRNTGSDAEQRPQARRTPGADRHRFARTRDRYRRRRPGLPGRLAAQHRGVSPARRPLGTPGRRHTKGRLFPTSRDDLIESAALLDCIRRDELDALRIPRAPLDVLAQQIVAEVACREWNEDALFDLVRRAERMRHSNARAMTPCCACSPKAMRAATGVRGSYLHRDSVTRTLRARRGGKLTAVTSGGTIPDNADYAVLLEPQGQPIGTVNEDFAVESLAGDVFQLGNTSYRILRIESGRVRVEDAHGAAPNIPVLARRGARAQRRVVGGRRAAARADRRAAGGVVGDVGCVEGLADAKGADSTGSARNS